jgi:parallel beta-helix repeat protein
MKMKFLKTVLIVCCCLYAQLSLATNYYLSSSTGDDTRTSAQASNAITPWKTIAKLNSLLSNLSPGDSVLFKRGETFYGAIQVKISGNSASQVVFGAYGSGAKPIISGFTVLSQWSSLGGGIYQSSCTACSVSDNLVVMNGAVQPIGRYPNSGYLAYQSHSGNSSITSSSMTGSNNWTGAEVVVRANHWILNRNPITSVSGSTINFTAASSDSPTDGFGFFIQKSSKTLDSLGEWYFEPTGKNMQVYFGGNSPASYAIKTSTVDVLVALSGYSYVTFDGLSFQGANISTFLLNNAQHITVKNCSIDMSGNDAIDGSASPYFTLQNSTIGHSLNDAVNLDQNCTNASINGNTIKNTGMIPGMGKSNTGSYDAITSFGANSTIQYNEIDSTAYDAIYFGGNSSTVSNNFINYFCLVKDDGGGIYIGDKSLSGSIRNITGNIVLNGAGAPLGTDKLSGLQADGIYMDDSSSQLNISSNTVATCADNGIKIHNANNVTIQNNVLFDNGTQLLLDHDNVAPNSPIRNASVTGNVLFSRTAKEFTLSLNTIANDIGSFGTLNNNYYCRPIDDNVTIYTKYVNSSGTTIIQPCDLATWQAAYNQDQASKSSPMTVAPYVLSGLVGANQDSNGLFNANINGMHAYSTLNDCVASWNGGGKLDGGALQVVSPNASGIVINVGAVSASQNYMLRFSAIGSNTDIMDAFLRQTASSYLALSSVNYFKVSPTRGEYEVLFSAPVSSSSTSIIFESYNPNSTYWLDNVQLYQANVNITDTNQCFQFLYNATSASKSFALNQQYVDPMGNIYSQSVTLKPYSSVVLIAKNAGTMTKIVKAANPSVTINTSPIVY